MTIGVECVKFASILTYSAPIGRTFAFFHGFGPRNTRLMTDRKSRRISTFSSRITSLVSVALVLVLLGLACLMGVAGKNLTDNLRRNLGFFVKMERECPEAQINIMKQSLISSPAVNSVTYTSAEDILAQESEYIGEEIGTMLDVNPYSPEFEVKVNPAYASSDSTRALTERYENAQGVQEIITESAVIEGVDSTLKRVGSILLIVAAIMLAVSVALINNTISLSIYGRRFVIHTMKLVGATGSFIRRPFILAGFVNGLTAGAIASAFLIGIRFYAGTIDPMLDQALPWFYVAAICVLLVLIGAAICVVTAMFVTNRYIKASYDEMFLK